jgi:hypothetical protein
MIGDRERIAIRTVAEQELEQSDRSSEDRDRCKRFLNDQLQSFDIPSIDELTFVAMMEL